MSSPSNASLDGLGSLPGGSSVNLASSFSATNLQQNTQAYSKDGRVSDAAKRTGVCQGDVAPQRWARSCTAQPSPSRFCCAARAVPEGRACRRSPRFAASPGCAGVVRSAKRPRPAPSAASRRSAPPALTRPAAGAHVQGARQGAAAAAVHRPRDAAPLAPAARLRRAHRRAGALRSSGCAQPLCVLTRGSGVLARSVLVLQARTRRLT